MSAQIEWVWSIKNCEFNEMQMTTCSYYLAVCNVLITKIYCKGISLKVRTKAMQQICFSDQTKSISYVTTYLGYINHN